MTPGDPDVPRRPDAADDHSGPTAPLDDPSIVPGLADPVPAPRADRPGGSRRVSGLDMSKDPDRFDPTRSPGPTRPLDMSKDPDRFDASASISVVGPLDPARDPDRYASAGEGQSLTDLIGKRGSYEEERDNYTWAIGLLSVLAFLAIVAFVFGEVLSP